MLSEARLEPSFLFAENVALLSLLSRAATEPRVNTRAVSADQESPHQVLSLERETDLTSTLAFLCGISDNPSHVVATCVEEPSDGKGIRVLVAINKERPGAGNDVLNRIKCGLEAIFRRLAHANNGPSCNTDARLLQLTVKQGRMIPFKTESWMILWRCANIASSRASDPRESTQNT